LSSGTAYVAQRYREAERPGGAPASDVQGHFLTHATQYYAERETAASHNLKEKAVQKSSAQRQEF